MTPGERARLAAVEEQLAAVSRELRATRAQLTFLRYLLAEECPEVARAERDAVEIMEAIRAPGALAGVRPVLRVLEGGQATGRRVREVDRDRHGLHAV
jgi:hypothetical protein